MFFIVLFSVLSFQVQKVREEVHFEYVLNIEETANNLVTIELPSKVTDFLKENRIQMPTAIKGGDIFNHFGISNIDIGQYSNNFVDQNIFNPIFEIINSIFFHIVTGVVLLVIIGVLPKSLLGRVGQLVIATYVLFEIAIYYTIVMAFISVLILAAILIPLIDLIKNEHYINRTKTYILEKRSSNIKTNKKSS